MVEDKFNKKKTQFYQKSQFFVENHLSCLNPPVFFVTLS